MKQFYHNLPVLVTGGAGFIGSHIVHKLVELGAKVTVIDNLETGFLKNLEPVQNSITFVNKSITNMDACIQATQGQKVIFHLAAFISVPDSIQNPQACHNTNINGTYNLLEAARINNVKRFVFSSSAAVYGPTEKTCSESMPCKPTSPYGTSKLIGELLCQQYTNNYNLQTICLRYFNVFGPRQNPNGAYAGVVAKFTQLMKKNRPITIFGDGKQTRDFIPVEQVAQANLALGMQNKTVMNGQPINIATGKSITLVQLVEQIQKKVYNYKKQLTFKVARKGDIQHSKADASTWKKHKINL
ncbi:NAD-dependent epimerase/dehydratase family protein [bacterium]|nr:NAD-dependent epimerase/dehydratase family protein [bacterium]